MVEQRDKKLKFSTTNHRRYYNTKAANSHRTHKSQQRQGTIAEPKDRKQRESELLAVNPERGRKEKKIQKNSTPQINTIGNYKYTIENSTTDKK